MMLQLLKYVIHGCLISYDIKNYINRSIIGQIKVNQSNRSTIVDP